MKSAILVKNAVKIPRNYLKIVKNVGSFGWFEENAARRGKVCRKFRLDGGN